MEIFEYEIHTSNYEGLHGGQAVTQIRKVLVAAKDDWEGYRTAIAMVWRNENNLQVTGAYWVP